MSFDPDGSIEFTRNKNLDAFFGGAGRMRRVTDIQKDFSAPLFFIKWLMGPFANTGRPGDASTGVHSLAKHINVFGKDYVAWDCRVDDNTGTLMFFTYEAAVQYEILCLNKMREQGIVFDAETHV